MAFTLHLSSVQPRRRREVVAPERITKPARSALTEMFERLDEDLAEL